MDAEELLDRMQDKIELGVSKGIASALKAHNDEVHVPLAAKIDKLHDRVTFWRGALWIISGTLTLALAVIYGGK